MDIDVLLCDHAEAINGKLFVNGAAINIFWVRAEPPHVITAHVAAVVDVPYTSTNQPHKVRVVLMDQDGSDVRPWVPEGAPEPPPVHMEAEFNVGRPPTLSPGESQKVPLAFGFQVPLREIATYTFRVDIDGTEMKRLPFWLEVRSTPSR